jgi:hypothetical protein
MSVQPKRKQKGRQRRKQQEESAGKRLCRPMLNQGCLSRLHEAPGDTSAIESAETLGKGAQMSTSASKQRFEKHLRIGIQFDGNQFVLLDGSPLPALSKNAVAELIVAPEAILDSVVRARFLEDRAVRILERGSHVFFGVSPTMVGNSKAHGLLSSLVLEINSDYWFVEGKLDAPLMLQVRGDQEARLSPCPCTIPALEKSAESLNHAFTLISEAFETKRRSHSGNVFERVYTQVTVGKWQSLDELRIAAIARMPSEMTFDPPDS